MAGGLDMIIDGLKNLAISIVEENPEILERDDPVQALKKRFEEIVPEFVQDRLFQDISPTIFGLVIVERNMAKQTL